ncbi:hypothetical protein CI109_105688 [Kwoniella shandongensis]|uniref:Uncharacterized protein n=1 Tax=Kwoniella shandongensis TaxID=1734106 RepID=A0A5M6C023_9TREE|nr:uncharacterized protein CI109_003028 [Kwoniella shandongensis]KAA5528496.1 hypothetical protein CI109_003028 [Kwoniella shandongensis]
MSDNHASASDLPPTASTSQPPVQPLKNPKYRHISRSAAKRESVQLLGSIKDLQLHFSRAGLVEHRPGAGVGVKSSNILSSLGEDDEENRPPSALSSSSFSNSNSRRGERKPWKEVDLPRIDPDQARKEAKGIVETVRGLWGLSAPSSSNSSTALPSSKSLYFPTNLASLSTTDEDPVDETLHTPHRSSEDIRSALVTTARSIRRIRTLALSISNASHSGRRVSGSSALLPPKTTSRMRSNFSTPSRPGGLPRAVSAGNATGNERKSSLGIDDVDGANIHKDDGLADLRKAALEVLSAIRALEERLRLELKEEEEAERALSPVSGGEGDEPHDPDISFVSNLTNENDTTLPSPISPTLHTEPEGYIDPEEEEDEYNLNVLAQEESQAERKTWEEGIEVERRQYKVLEDTEWEKEARGTREGVGKWVGQVERLFTFALGNETQREIEIWAKGDEEWEGRTLEQLHAFLSAHLPVALTLRLPSIASSDFASSFLASLSDGYIIIQAYNSSLLSSSKPWGLIPEEDIHDTLTSVVSGTASPPVAAGEEGSKKEKEWTFRKVGNLTCFGAALKHRYQLPVSMPSSNITSSTFLPIPSRSNSTSPNPTSSSKTKDLPKIEYDPMVIAKRGEGWEGMLQEVLGKWVEEVGRERREGRGEVARSEQRAGGWV